MNKQMNEFLKLEYEQCLSLIKYYDERHQALVRYCAGVSSAVPSLLLGFYQLGADVTPHFWSFTALVAGITTIGLLAIYTVLIQTRLYFVYPARQVNAIRKAALKEVADIFDCNQMYTDIRFNAFKWSSSYSLLNIFVALQVGAFLGLTVFALCVNSLSRRWLTFIAITIALVTAALIFSISGRYLYIRSRSHPDVSVHRGELLCDDDENKDS